MTDLDRTGLRTRINQLYRRELEELGGTGAHAIADEAAERWDLSPTLAGGGVVGFAHVNVADCGLHVAAAVNAALDTGADTVLAISVLHAFTPEMELARRHVSEEGGSPYEYPFWGVQGPGLDFRDEWRGDHAMRALRHFWEAETRRRGVTGRRLVEHYPFLAAGNPGDLPHIDEVAAIAEDAVVVATGDQFHHGIGYGMAPEASLAPDTEGITAARASMEKGIALLEAEDYRGYDRHCVEAKSDDRDAAQLFTFLRRPLRGRLLDIAWSDATALYDRPAPTWAAGGFFEFERVS